MAKSMEWRNFAWFDSCLYTPQRSPFAGPGYVEAPLLDTQREESIGGYLFVLLCFVEHDLEKSINDGKTCAST